MIAEPRHLFDIINPTPIQVAYMKDQHRFPVCSAGRRSRKTVIGVRKVLSRALRNTGRNYFFGAPTHQQAKAIFWESQWTGINRIIPSWMILDKSISELRVSLISGSWIQIVGLDRPQRIEGRPWYGGLITETADLKPGIWEANIRPLLSDTGGFCILDGVPEGRNHYYDMALRAAGGFIPSTKPLQGAFASDPNDPEWAFFSWYSSDVLPLTEIESARRDMDERTFRQEYEGSFELETGRAYYSFSIDNVIPDREVRPAHVHIGMDFNVDPMTAAICEVAGEDVLQYDEVFLRHSNTMQMIDFLIHEKGIDPTKATIYPDATGGAESTNASKSDLKLLKQAGFNVRAHEANPRQRDRIAAVNTRCRTASGDIHYRVMQRCRHTINDLNRVEVLPDGRLDKQQADSMLTHISDGLGYLIAYLFPVGKKNRFEMLKGTQAFY